MHSMRCRIGYLARYDRRVISHLRFRTHFGTLHPSCYALLCNVRQYLCEGGPINVRSCREHRFNWGPDQSHKQRDEIVNADLRPHGQGRVVGRSSFWEAETRNLIVWPEMLSFSATAL